MKNEKQSSSDKTRNERGQAGAGTLNFSDLSLSQTTTEYLDK
jgi:hypothetical protein